MNVAEFFEPLPGLDHALKEDERKDDDEYDVKEEQVTLATVYQDEPIALNILKARLTGEAPWLEDSIPYPIVTLQVPYSPRGIYFDYEPKIFYYLERTYEDWLKMDGSQHLFHWRQESSEVCLEASPFSYRQTWYCHCAGKPEIKKKAEGKKRRQVFKSSKHMGWHARVYVHKFMDDHPPTLGYSPVNLSKRVRLTCYGRHTGHVLGNIEGFQHLHISKQVQEAILGYIKLGLGNQAIKDKLTLHSDALHSRLLKRDFVFRWNKIMPDGSDKFGYGFSSPWQLDKLRVSEGAVGLDSTHNTCKGKAELYTVIIQYPQTMRGILVAFLLTENKTTEPLQEWLVALEAHAGTCFRYITTDDSKVEYKAIKDGFNDHVQIYLCLWHVARAWSLQIKKLTTNSNHQKQLELQADARQFLHKIMYEHDRTIANKLIILFRQVWRVLSKPFIDYMEENCFKEICRRLWMKSYRQDIYYASMSTNNYCIVA
ncbi:hypothetical protein BG015_004373, partial [Linnemannia schmuckeri]